jgi:starch synthase
MAELKVLFATSEISPWIKTGGLADVSGALPAALRAIGVDVRVLVPGYNQVMVQLAQSVVATTLDNLPGFPAARLLSGKMANDIPIFVLDCPALYQRAGGPYQDASGHDWTDNAQRFGLLSKVAALLGSSASPLAWHPDLVHCNDWQTGLAPAYLHFAGRSTQRDDRTQPGFSGNFSCHDAGKITFAAILFQYQRRRIFQQTILP